MFTQNALSGQIYKFKDENGNWTFSDKKPTSELELEIIERRPAMVKNRKPKIYLSEGSNKHTISAINPYHAPIEVEIKIISEKSEEITFRKVMPPSSKISLYDSKDVVDRFLYSWVLGSPQTTESSYIYHLPISSLQEHRISQSFNGNFSHHKPSNKYAVDIAMPIGTYISAARGGTVIWVKDDYHMGGAKKYFLDKANYVSVLHSDGSYATYAHILQETAMVKPGDKVKAGDILARSGSSGFSTGPHLHFVIRKNIGFSAVSVPFKFLNEDGESFVPQKGMMVFNHMAPIQEIETL
ncbi:M23 family metallopeptidase [Microbulbifer echini]